MGPKNPIEIIIKARILKASLTHRLEGGSCAEASG